MRYRVPLVCYVFLLVILPLNAGAAKSVAAKPAFEGEDDICLTQKVVIQKNGEIDVTGDEGSSRYTSCNLARDLGGCKPETIRAGMCKPCGEVSFTSPSERPCPTISKCARDYKQRRSACFQKMGIESADEIDLSDPAAARAAVENLDLTSSADREVLAGVLQGMGVSGITDAHVNENPDVAKDLALKILDGDEEGAKAAARELGLNDDLKNVAYLRPADDGEEDPDEAEARAAYARDTTFGDPADTGNPAMNNAKKAIACLESGCGNYNAVGPRVCNSRGCGSAYGKYQVMWFNIPSWTARSCGRTIYNPEEFRADTACQERVFETMFTQHVNACGGSYAGAASMWHSGSCVPRAGSSDGYMRTATYVSKFNCYFSGQCTTPAYALSGYQGRGSPFGNLNPFVGSSPSGYSSSAGASGGGYAQAPQQYPQQQYPQQQPPRPPVIPVSSQILPSGTQTGVSGTLPPAPVQPVAALVVQPKEVTRGNPITVSWSSVGMSRLSPCSVSIEQGGVNALLVQGNEGTKLVPTSATTTPGIWNFTLQCTLGNGSTIRQSASVSIR